MRLTPESELLYCLVVSLRKTLVKVWAPLSLFPISPEADFLHLQNLTQSFLTQHMKQSYYQEKMKQNSPRKGGSAMSVEGQNPQ